MMEKKDGPLRPLAERWLEKIKLGIKSKKKHFTDSADEIMKFFDGPHDFMYQKQLAHSQGMVMLDKSQAVRPTFGVTINKAAEAVDLYLPMIHAKNPIPVVRPRKEVEFDIAALGPLLPVVGPMLMSEDGIRKAVKEIRASEMETALLYCVDEADQHWHSRMAVMEGFLKGRGVLWPTQYQVPGQKSKVCVAEFDTVNNLVTDPDYDQLKDCYWVARKRIEPYWVVEDKFGWQRGSLKYAASCESHERQAEVSADPEGQLKRKNGQTSDLLTYWEIWSKLGVGDKLGGDSNRMEYSERTSGYEGIFDFAGDYVYLAVCSDCPSFLNIPPDLEEADLTQPLDPAAVPEVDPATGEVIQPETYLDELMRRLDWPTPFWADKGSWPFVELDLRPHPDKPWPTAHLKPAMGELKFMDWAASFLADAMMTTTRQFIAVVKSASEKVKEIVQKGECFSIIELEGTQKAIGEVVQFMQHPPVSRELLEIFQVISNLFDKRTGLNELIYGQTARQMRSAAEVQAKTSSMNIRPDDMAGKVEDWMRRVFKSLAIVLRWHFTAADVAPMVGQQHAMLWQQFVETSDIEEIVHELDYTIEAGSGRKPNKATEAENMTNAMQYVMPHLLPWAQMTGNVDALNQLLRDWCRAYDLDPERYVIPAPMPMMPPQAPPAAEGQEGQEQAPMAA